MERWSSPSAPEAWASPRPLAEIDEQATGPDADRAKAAAVKLVGGGSAVGVERDDDDGAAWEVEVKKPDGSVVEVGLTSDLKQAGVERDDDDGSGEARARARTTTDCPASDATIRHRHEADRDPGVGVLLAVRGRVRGR